MRHILNSGSKSGTALTDAVTYQMKPELGPSFFPTWQGIPPGMPAGDLQIWLRYRDVGLSLWHRMYFNVRIGDPIFLEENYPEEIREMAQALSRRRIDVVGETMITWYLIELKYNAGTEALGQILMYRALWESDPPDNRLVKLFIITDRANKDLSAVCPIYGVELVVV